MIAVNCTHGSMVRVYNSPGWVTRIKGICIIHTEEPFLARLSGDQESE